MAMTTGLARVATIFVVLALGPLNARAQGENDLFVDIIASGQRIEEIDMSSVKLTVTWCDLTVDMYTSDDDAGFDLHSLIMSWPGMDSSLNLLEVPDDPGTKAITTAKTALVISFGGDCSRFSDAALAEMTFVGRKNGENVSVTDYNVRIQYRQE